MPVFSLTSRRRATLATLAERVLEAPDLTGLTRLLTVDLRQALAAENASLLLWDRRLEVSEKTGTWRPGLTREKSRRYDTGAGAGSRAS